MTCTIEECPTDAAITGALSGLSLDSNMINVPMPRMNALLTPTVSTLKYINSNSRRVVNKSMANIMELALKDVEQTLTESFNYYRQTQEFKSWFSDLGDGKKKTLKEQISLRRISEMDNVQIVYEND